MNLSEEYTLSGNVKALLTFLVKCQATWEQSSPLHTQENNENVEIQFQITSHTRRTPISLI